MSLSTTPALQEVLVKIAKTLNENNIKWLLGGSGSLMVHGLDIAPHDLDILTTTENIPYFVEKFKQDKIANDKNLQFRIEGINIEIIEIENLGSPKLVAFQSVLIPVNSLEEELSYYKQRPDKQKIVKLIEASLTNK